MRTVLLSDIHANVDALRAALTDAADLRAERVVCLGDVLGYGPDPVAALELVHRSAHVCLAGNHDDAVCGRFPLADFTDFAAAAVRRHRAALAREGMEWLERLPHTCAFDGFACAHGDFSDPENFNYVLEAEDAPPSWRARDEQLLFVGHTHEPCIFVTGRSGTPHKLPPEDFTLEPGKRYIVNPGSVGYPRHGACRISYCVYDDETRTVTFRSLPFDLETYTEKMHGQGLHEAPWMEARARERRRPNVRASAAFGRKAAGTHQTQKKKRIKETGVVTIVRPEKSNGWVKGLVAAAVVVSVGGLMCTLRLVDALPKKDAGTELARAHVAEVPPAVTDTAKAFAQEVPLVNGWTAAYENPAEQRVRIEHNKKRNETVFRIEHAAARTVRLAKRLPLLSKPAKLYHSVELLTAAKPGVKESFQFSTRVAFFDGAGKNVGESLGGGKRSARNKSCDVPPGAETAVFTVDCRCAGTYDLDVPHIGETPRAARAKRQH